MDKFHVEHSYVNELLTNYLLSYILTIGTDYDQTDLSHTKSVKLLPKSQIPYLVRLI